LGKQLDASESVDVGPVADLGFLEYGVARRDLAGYLGQDARPASSDS